jgi:DNA-binding transcriptional ArsR family regulator
MSDPNDFKGLRFACDCVSAYGEYSDPWAGISKNKLLPNGTKEDILNSVSKQPKTVAQVAKELDLSQPTIHRHINELMASQLLRESEEWERRYPTERYYEPNFPVVKAEERAEFEAICQEMAGRVAGLFERRRKQLEEAFDKTDLTKRGWTFVDITQYLYANIQRGAREILEERGALPQREKHNNGAEWIFWAEESGSNK